jgi:N-acetylneuraminic acid mutarotase
VEAGQAVIGGRLYLMGGYETIATVVDVVDVFDVRKGRWTDQFPMPSGMAQTHTGIASDGKRFIYIAGGQLGPHCSPAVASCRVLDASTHTWTELPPLPEPRYAPVLQLWRGRLHAVAGSRPDRGTPASEHWSIAVNDGQALEGGWRAEVPIPLGGTHRASTVFGDALYVFGGHGGDVKPLEGDPNYTCDWNSAVESALSESFLLEPGVSQWKAIAPMPEPRSHTEHAIVQIGACAVVVGGVKSHTEYSDLIQSYDTRTDRWKIVGRLPYGMKTNATYHEGWSYVITGQRTRSMDDLNPGVVVNSVWRTKIDPASL